MSFDDFKRIILAHPEGATVHVSRRRFEGAVLTEPKPRTVFGSEYVSRMAVYGAIGLSMFAGRHLVWDE